MSLWTTAVYEDENGRSPFATWLSGLSEAKFAALDAAITQVLCQRGIDLAGTEWLKALGEGLWEFRVRHDAAEINHMFGNEVTAPLRREGILLRVFCHFHGNKVILLLGGYDKGRDPSDKRQEKEIARARKCLTAWQEAQKREAARRRKA
jgi:putative component of toxin-antitoxin plasmid stabilization module